MFSARYGLNLPVGLYRGSSQSFMQITCGDRLLVVDESAEGTVLGNDESSSCRYEGVRHSH